MPLRRVSLDGREGSIDEDWLQRLIDDVPAVIPVQEVCPMVRGTLFSLGREIATDSGPIDNVLVSQSGHVVVVETKLWRNPQARREVVAQIIDYAKHVVLWDHSKLEALWRGRHGSQTTLHQGVAPEEDEASWIDGVNDRLERGELALLVVGDGIESRAESLAETVGIRPDLQFRLALLELQLHRLDDDSLIVIPHTLARTAEIERATVRVVYVPEAKPSVSVDVPLPAPSGRGASGARITLDAQAFLASIEAQGSSGTIIVKVVREILRQLEPHTELMVEWKSAGFSVRAPDPATDGGMLSLFVVNRPNLVYAYPGWIRDQISRGWGDVDVGKAVAKMLTECLLRFGGRQTASGQVNVSLTALEGREPELIEAIASLYAEIRKLAENRGE